MQKKALVVNNVNKTYKNGVVALKNASLSVNMGEFFGLLGKNGAGKSTLINILAGITNKSSGKATVQGINIDTDHKSAKSLIGIVPQELNLAPFDKVYDVVYSQAGYNSIPFHKAKQKTEKYLKQMQLWSKAGEYTRSLSGGMKRRVMIARALVNEPSLIILDEPTAGVDIELRYDMWNYLRSLNTDGKTIILTTHYIDEAQELCERVSIISQGTVIDTVNVSSVESMLRKKTFIVRHSNALRRSDRFSIKPLTDNTFEATVSDNETLNDLFGYLTRQGVAIESVRVKQGHLEQYFLEKTGENK